MLDVDTRGAVLRLAKEGHSSRKIAQALGIARSSVRVVLRSGCREVPEIERESLLTGQEEQVKELYRRCKGNRVRVHELLVDAGIGVSYQAVTRFCRELELGRAKKERVGHYPQAPGGEMQHDTSPHRVEIGGGQCLLQCASLILPYSRMRYSQVYKRWNRLQCRQFLIDGLSFFGGSARVCVVDNSSVVLRAGGGVDAIPADDMAALARHFGFVWLAHTAGDPDRKAHVEKGFDYIEQNFYPGRDFASIEDCNAQLRTWCCERLARINSRLDPPPTVLWAEERLQLIPLPPHIPPVYVCHQRKVDVESYVSLHTNRYPVRERWIGKLVEIREEVGRVVIHDGHTPIAEYGKAQDGARVRLPWPKAWATRSSKASSLSPEEESLRRVAPDLGPLLDALRVRYGGQGRKGMRRLHRLWLSYPSDAVLSAAQEAMRFGMTDLDRLESMVLRRVATDYFKLREDDDE